MFDVRDLSLQYAVSDELFEVWTYLSENDLVNKVFCGDNIRDYTDFESELYDDFVFAVRYLDNLVGLVWLNTFENNTARIHFIVLPKSRLILLKGGEEVIRRILDWRKGKTILFHTLYGYVPIWNNGAIKYYKKLGFRHFVDIPDLAFDIKTGKRGFMSCSYINKEIFDEFFSN